MLRNSALKMVHHLQICATILASLSQAGKKTSNADFFINFKTCICCNILKNDEVHYVEIIQNWLFGYFLELEDDDLHKSEASLDPKTPWILSIWTWNNMGAIFEH
jgi:hypothetical protein